LLSLLAFLLHILDVSDLLLGSRATGAAGSTTFDTTDRHRLIHPLVVLLGS